MNSSFAKMLSGYHQFRKKYAMGDDSIMKYLADFGQQPKLMLVACCDSRVDPALILQCDPGDLFIARNVANIIPPYEKDETHHGTSAALEFGIRFLQVEDLIILGHSQCGGIQALINQENSISADFITNWVSLIQLNAVGNHDVDECARLALHHSYQNCFSFPFIKNRADQGLLNIHRWFFDIHSGQIYAYQAITKQYEPL